MAKATQITVSGINLLDNERIEWTRFKNTPATLVSATGHDHDSVYYRTSVVNSLFQTQEDRISQLELDIEVLSYKTDAMLGGGGTVSNNTINNYNLSTETFSTITPVLLTPSLNSPGISTQSSGYFFSNSTSTNKIDYFTLIVEATPNCTITPHGSLIDFAIQSKGFVTDGSNWSQLNTLLDTWTAKDVSTSGCSNQVMLSSMVQGFTKGDGFGMLREYSHSSGSSREIIEFTTSGDTVGLCKSSIRGFWLSKVGFSFIHDYVTDTISSLSSVVNNCNGASTCTTEFYGAIISGSNSLLVQKLTWSTLAISNMTGISVDKTGATSVEV